MASFQQHMLIVSNECVDGQRRLGLVANRDFCDAVITCNGKEFNVHRFVLSEKSEIFHLMFTKDFAENRGDCPRINLDSFSTEIVEVLLAYLYSGELRLTKEQLFEAIFFADMFFIVSLKQKLEVFLSSIIRKSNVNRIVSTARLTRCSNRVIRQCECTLFEMLNRIGELHASRIFLKLDPESVYCYFAIYQCAVPDEDTVVALFYAWWCRNKDQHSLLQTDTLRMAKHCIRYDRLSSNVGDVCAAKRIEDEAFVQMLQQSSTSVRELTTPVRCNSNNPIEALLLIATGERCCRRMYICLSAFDEVLSGPAQDVPFHDNEVHRYVCHGEIITIQPNEQNSPLSHFRHDGSRIQGPDMPQWDVSEEGFRNRVTLLRHFSCSEGDDDLIGVCTYDFINLSVKGLKSHKQGMCSLAEMHPDSRVIMCAYLNHFFVFCFEAIRTEGSSYQSYVRVWDMKDFTLKVEKKVDLVCNGVVSVTQCDGCVVFLANPSWKCYIISLHDLLFKPFEDIHPKSLSLPNSIGRFYLAGLKDNSYVKLCLFGNQLLLAAYTKYGLTMHVAQIDFEKNIPRNEVELEWRSVTLPMAFRKLGEVRPIFMGHVLVSKSRFWAR